MAAGRSSGGQLGSARLPVAITAAKHTSIPGIPVDWIFKFFPRVCRDRVRFMWRFNQISFLSGFGYVYWWSHMPFKGAHYEGMSPKSASPLYWYRLRQLENSGKLEGNLRVKVHH